MPCMYIPNKNDHDERYAHSAVPDFFHCHLIYDLRAMAPVQDELWSHAPHIQWSSPLVLARAIVSQRQHHAWLYLCNDDDLYLSHCTMQYLSMHAKCKIVMLWCASILCMHYEHVDDVTLRYIHYSLSPNLKLRKWVMMTYDEVMMR